MCDEIENDFKIDLINKYEIMQQISPAAACENNSYSFIHKSIYEFFIAQSIIQETLKAKLQAIDEHKTMLGTAFLSNDLDALTFVSEHVIETPVS